MKKAFCTGNDSGVLSINNNYLCLLYPVAKIDSNNGEGLSAGKQKDENFPADKSSPPIESILATTYRRRKLFIF